MIDAWLLVEWSEGYTNNTGSPSTWTVEDDYYNPVIICKTRQELVDFLGENAVWNGDTAELTIRNWNGEIKHVDVFYAIPVEFGKLLSY